ncbi:MAG: hypothetical protein H6970_08680 [Gammaproteobacteria bacterium]|nr:hypothetical protein [Gammaproteobacteria bacterium]MCP5425128.1 hypothetical protein [Gammaproteobacteria bacterium]MCP5459815.1 hypothetical protein [Gammaproteobacteria bacterium]
MRSKLLKFAALALIGFSSIMTPAIAGSKYHTVSDFLALLEDDTRYNYDYERTINLGAWEFHSPWKVLHFYLPDDFDPTYEAVLQLNINSTNKSQYNALYLNPMGFDENSFSGCSSAQQDNYAEERLTWLPYVDHDHWQFFHKTFTGFRLHPGENVLLICSRTPQGDSWGELDNFYLKDIVLHYRKRLLVYYPDPQ